MSRFPRLLLALLYSLVTGFGAGWMLHSVDATRTGLDYHPLISLGMAMVFCVTAMVVIVWAHPFSTAVSLSAFSVLAGLAIVTAPAADDGVPMARDLMFVYLALVPIPFVHFFTNFPQPAEGERRSQWRIWLVVAVGGVLLLTRWLLLHFGLDDRLVSSPLFMNLATGLLMGTGLAWRSYRTARHPHQRDQLKVIATGLLAGVAPFVLLSVLPAAMLGRPLLSPGLTALGTVLLPIGFGYAVMRRDLLGIDLVISRSLIYGALGVALLFVYAAALAAMRAVIPFWLGQENMLLTLGVTVAAVACYGPIKARLERAVDRRIYGDDYDYAEVTAWFSQQLTRIQPADALARSCVDRLVTTLNLRYGQVLLARSPHPLAAPGERDRSLVQEVAARGTPGEGTGPEFGVEALRPRVLPLIRDGFRVVLVSQGRMLGILQLGPKAPACNFSRRDLALIASLAPQLAVALDNALLVEQLQMAVGQLDRMQVELRRVQDEERQSLARDLHDGLLQQLIYLRRLAEFLAGSPGGQPVPTGQLLNAIQTTIAEVRAVCLGLQPLRLEDQGLATALAELAESTRDRYGLVIQFALVTPGAAAELPAPMRLSLLRAAQEMVQNVITHAGATEAYIYLEEAQGTLTLSVWDNGRGFVVPVEIMDLVRQGHLGLANLYQRAHQFGGRLEIHSETGLGTEVALHIPTGGGAREREHSAS